MWRSHLRIIVTGIAVLAVLIGAGGDGALAVGESLSLEIAPAQCRAPAQESRAAPVDALWDALFGSDYLSFRNSKLALGSYGNVMDSDASAMGLSNRLSDRPVFAALEGASQAANSRSLADEMPDARRAEDYLALGQYTRAFDTLFSALDRAKTAGDGLNVAAAEGALGNAYFLNGDLEKAGRYLDSSLAAARELQADGLVAATLNNLGNVYQAEFRYDAARIAYQESIEYALAGDNPGLAATAAINGARLSKIRIEWSRASTLLDTALTILNGLPDSYDKGFGLVTAGRLAYELWQASSSGEADGAERAYSALSDASAVAERIGDSRIASYALGYLGELYENSGRRDEAMQLTSRAMFAAQEANAPESLYRWLWQSGRLFKSAGNADAAITMFRRSLDTLQTIRADLTGNYRGRRSSFRTVAGPLLTDLTDVLLARATVEPEGAAKQRYLREALNTTELFKTAELQDYFEDECVAVQQAKQVSIDRIAPRTAVIYPILLEDRLELLLNLPSGLKQITQAITADKVTKQIRWLRRRLEKRTTHQYLVHARRLYDMVIRPMEEFLIADDVDTLVIIPEGPMRTIPFATLHDGEKFLISKYALATAPSLSLVDPQPLKRDKINILISGLSVSVDDFPALPFVEAEIDAIKNVLTDSRVLLNDTFVLKRLDDELRQSSFSIVHIASHGEFGSGADESFLLAFDGKLTLDGLESFMKLSQFRDEPVELLTLSACKTAAGDDRSALGLAGVAVKAGARSALATLWSISDQATAILLAEFYRQLTDPTVSKAVALQNAQRAFIEDDRLVALRHPAYWSPFLLIGNWL